jgi:hypothetical protein
MTKKIATMQRELASVIASGDQTKVAELQKQIAAARRELKTTFAAKKAEEKAEQARIHAEERAADHEFSEMLKHHELPKEKK